MFRLLCLAVLSSFLALASGLRAEARSLALLVGVSDYDEAIGLADLRGPANDIALLADVLSARGAFDIRLLADGIDGATRPTRAAILDAFDALERDATAGDFIYIHMSGHGTQQADRNGDESDGADEVFLPADTARAEPGSSVIPNAIIDEELGARITALRRKGADVWFVLDSCHSGSGLRAAAPGSAARFVDPQVLGVTLDGPADVSAAIDTSAEDLPGKYLAFYAAQSSEVAREVQMDAASPDSWYGLFSATLAARLQTDQGQSYRQLFQAILADMSDGSLPGSARLQTPLWEGNLIDAPVFGGAETIGLRQFAVEGGRIQAGKLHGLRDNSVVALVADAAAAPQDVLAYAQLETTDARSAALAKVAGDCAASVDAPCPRLGAIPDQARFARLVAKPRDMALRITPPFDLRTGQPAPATHAKVRALTAAIDAVNAAHGTRIVLDPAGQVLSGLADGALWFGPRISAGDTPIGLRWSPGEPLEPLLMRIARAEDIAATFASVAGTPSLLFPSPVDITIERLNSDPARLGREAPSDLMGECRAALAAPEITRDLPAGTSLKQCDHLIFGGQGNVQGPARDVNRIYIDSQYCVSARYQRVEGTRRPALLGPAITICSDCPDGPNVSAKAGVERLFMVVSEAEDNREALNLEGVLDNCAPTPSGTRSGATAQVADLLQTLGNSDPTRGGMGGIGIASLWVEPFTWQVLPRQEALARHGLAQLQSGDKP